MQLKKENIDPFLEEASKMIDIQKNNQKLGQDIEEINFNFSPLLDLHKNTKKTLSESLNYLFINANLCELIPDEKRNITSAIFKSFEIKNLLWILRFLFYAWVELKIVEFYCGIKKFMA